MTVTDGVSFTEVPRLKRGLVRLTSAPSTTYTGTIMPVSEWERP